MGENGEPDYVEWQPPHLPQPVRIQRPGRARKPMRPWVIWLGVMLAPLGVAVQSFGVFGMRSSLEGAYTFVALGSYFMGPALAVSGVIILALARSRAAWLTALGLTFAFVTAAYFGTREVALEYHEKSCLKQSASECLERARMASSTKERAGFEKRACELGAASGCAQWDRDDDKATANETMRRYCAEKEPTQTSCGARDFHGFCAKEPKKQESPTLDVDATKWECR